MFTEIKKYEACHVIIMPINLFYWKIRFTAYLACDFSDIVFSFLILLYRNASIAKILFILWDLV